MLKITNLLFCTLFLILFFVSCGEKSVSINKTGSEGFDCFPNDTCNTGLVCVDGTCEKEVTDESLDEDISDDTTDEVIDESQDSDETADNIPDEVIDESLDEDISDDTTDEQIDEDTVDDTWILINGDYWLKEESLIIFNYDSTGINDIFDIRTMLQSKCDEIGGRLPSIDDFRKNITDPAFENFDMSYDTDDCGLYSKYSSMSCKTVDACETRDKRCNTYETVSINNKTESEYFYFPNYIFYTDTIIEYNGENIMAIFKYKVEEGSPNIKETMSIQRLSSIIEGWTITLTCIKK
ncbi:MAG TPA: hypothetical protein PLZ43_16000 [bacterium]|nr:hypothetical protein [bacterium]